MARYPGNVLEDDPVASAALAAHEADTTGVHGIPDTAQLADQGDIDASVATHAALTRADDVHGIDAELDAIETTLATKADSAALGTAAAADTTDFEPAGAVASEAAARDAAINALVNGAPALLDTLAELAAAIQSDEASIGTLTTNIATKLAKASNLSDLADPAAARGNLGLGDAATKNTGTGSTQVAAGDDSRFPTTGQKNALAGTAGTPGTANPYATKQTTDALALASDLATETARAEGVEGGLDSRVDTIEATRPKFDLKRDFSAKGDGKTVTDGAMTSGSAVLACTTSAPFTPADVGKSIVVLGAAAAGAHNRTTISGYTDSGHVTLANAAATTVSGAFVVFGTDDTAAIQAAVTAMAAAKTALCSVPDGIYVMAANVVTGNGIAAQVLFPPNTNASQPLSIGFVGQSVPFGMPESVQVNGTDMPVDTQGPIFCSLRSAPSGTSPSVFGVDKNASGAVLSKSVITFDGVTIRCVPTNAITALNLFYAAGMDLGSRYGLRIDTISAAPSIPQPQAAPASSYGLVTPKYGNWGHNRIGNLDISGYTYGMSAGEHISALNVNISFCLQAIQMISGYLGVWIGRFSQYACPRGIVSAATSNPVPINIGQWAIQNEPGINQPTWIELVNHLDAAVTAGALLQGSADTVIRALGGTGNIATELVRDVTGGGKIAFRIGRQFANSPSAKMLDPGAPRQIEINALATPKSTVGTWALTQSSANYDGGTQFNSSNAQNDAITFYDIYLAAGTWQLDRFGRDGTSGAIATFEIRDQDGVLVASGTIDTYAAVAASNRGTITGLVIPNSGLHTVSMKAATRNASSSGWTIQASRLCLTRTA